MTNNTPKFEITDQTLIVDSREKWTQSGSTDKHLSTWFKRHGVNWVVKKLEVGDYTTFGGKVTIDRKQSVEEISKNLTNPADKKRFMAEVRRSYQFGLHLVVLIESNTYRDVYDLRKWRSTYSHVSGTTLIRQMERLAFAYGVQFVFCNKKSVSRRICEILNVDFLDRPLPQMGGHTVDNK